MAKAVVKVHQVCSVRPPHETNTSPTSLRLTLFDTPFITHVLVEHLFLYEYPHLTNSNFFDSLVPTLKHSLSITLEHFLPLAGNITWPHHASEPIINYVPGDSVSFTVAELSSAVDLFSDQCEGEQRHPLVPRLNTSHDKASILAVQVTLFPNAGFSIGIITHHGALDGKSGFLFIQAWAYICQQLKESQKPSFSLPENLTPSFDRSLITDPSGINQVYLNMFFPGHGETNHHPSFKTSWDDSFGRPVGDDVVKASFEFTPSHIQKLKQYANSKIQNNKFQFSSFSVTYAYLLACAVKIEQPISHKVAFMFPVDCRHRLEPPLKSTYMGNCVLSHVAVLETKALLGDDGFINALVGITHALKSLEGGVADIVQNWMSKIVPMYNNTTYRLFNVTMSPQFDVYGVDFGWGRPKKVDMPSTDRGGDKCRLFCFFKRRDHDGGIEISFATSKPQMEAYAKLFTQGLESLHVMD